MALQLIQKLEMLLSCPQIPNPFTARTYPWGESFDADKANVELTIGETSAVGCYATGFSPYGCEDLSGNVREWTRSLSGNDESWVLRGGSWVDDRGYARCAYRYGFHPADRGNGIGIRVVLRSTPILEL
jgi:formylglycine-generating enzyme required for sulfatase activity